jgi:transposase InsO family protein
MIDVYSRFVVAKSRTNKRMETIMKSVKEMIEEIGDYPENLNCDNQFNVPSFTKFFSEHGTKLWFSQPEQPYKNAVIEIFWRTLALLLQIMRSGTKNFNWVKELPNAIKNYNTTFHRTLQATPEEVFEGKKENPVERKVVESVLKKGDKVRVKSSIYPSFLSTPPFADLTVKLTPRTSFYKINREKFYGVTPIVITLRLLYD